MEKKTERTSQPQVKYLKERLRDAEWKHRSEIGKAKCDEPASVKAARQTISRWERSARKAFYAKQERRRNAVRAAVAETQRTLLFGTPQEALKAVDAFAGRKF